MENKNKHILIVDDDNGIRDLLKDYLKKNKFIVSTSENAEDAKKKLTTFIKLQRPCLFMKLCRVMKLEI